MDCELDLANSSSQIHPNRLIRDPFDNKLNAVFCIMPCMPPMHSILHAVIPLYIPVLRFPRPFLLDILVRWLN